MNLRGFARLGAAAAAATLLVGALGAPAYAEPEVPEPDLPLLATEPTTADDFATKNCAGIGDGQAAPGAEGWLFNKPAGADKVAAYVIIYATTFEDDGEIVPLLLKGDGIFIVDLEALLPAPDPDTAAKAFATAADSIDPDDIAALPTLPAPVGVSGKLVDSGGWIRTPGHYVLVTGLAVTQPVLTEGTFDLVSTCLAANATAPASPSPSASASPSPGPQLPVTGSNVGLLSGAGAGLVVLGAVLFLAYRRRRNVKFVA